MIRYVTCRSRISSILGISNTGADENYLALTASAHTDDDMSFLYLPSFGPNNSSGGWAALSDVFLTDISGDTTFVFRDRVFPIRAEFILATPAEQRHRFAVPREVTLQQNYPNPFNPATSIGFSLPRSMYVRLSVYDALGRLVSTLIDGVHSSGDHSIRLDASTWANGVYLYILQTEVQTISEQMVLLR